MIRPLGGASNSPGLSGKKLHGTVLAAPHAVRKRRVE